MGGLDLRNGRVKWLDLASGNRDRDLKITLLMVPS
jgi:hypothetical protein